MWKQNFYILSTLGISLEPFQKLLEDFLVYIHYEEHVPSNAVFSIPGNKFPSFPMQVPPLLYLVSVLLNEVMI